MFGTGYFFFFPSVCVCVCRLIVSISRYRRVFQYLLRLKRTQMELEKSWASVMHQDHTDFANKRNDRTNCSIFQQRRQRFRPMWPIREHMAFLIRNLQFYIQVHFLNALGYPGYFMVRVSMAFLLYYA